MSRLFVGLFVVLLARGVARPPPPLPLPELVRTAKLVVLGDWLIGLCKAPDCDGK
jgi:hypothetical protein